MKPGPSLAVTVLPYFWQTKWFMALAVLTTLGSVAGSVRYVVKAKIATPHRTCGTGTRH